MSEQPSPAMHDPKALRRCLGSFATGVAVITTRHGDRDVGITVNSFTSVSLEPPLVLWCLARTSRTFAVFSAAPHFVVNILSADQVEISNRFAFRSEEAFPEDVAFRRALAEVPVLEGSSAHLQCRTADVVDAGDHVILLGEVLDFAMSGRPGLVYSKGEYAVAERHPSARTRSRDAGEAGFLATTVQPALDDVTHRFETFFDDKLRDAGISSKESQILGLLLSEGPRCSETIANRSLVSGSFLEETLESLSEKGLITQQQALVALTPDGEQLASEWFQRLQDYRLEALGSLTPEETRTLRRTLDRLSEWIEAASAGTLGA